MKIAPVLAASFVVAAGSAFAAELTTKYPVKAMVAPPPPYSWTGFYVGLNAGYAWSNNDTSYDYTVPSFASDTAGMLARGVIVSSQDSSTGGFMGGAQAGYNYQIGPIILGIEADAQYTHQKTSQSYSQTEPQPLFPAVTTATTTTTNGELEWFGTLRGRIGVAATTRAIVYATGGLAYGGVSSVSAISQTISSPFGAFTSTAGGVGSGVKVGWTVGGGAEYAFTGNLIGRIEYLYYDLGSETYAFAGAPAFAGSVASQTFTGSIVRAGLSWKF